MYFVLLIMKFKMANFDLCEKSPPISPLTESPTLGG